MHLLLGELSDVLDCLGGSQLELDTLESLVQVKSVVAAGWLHLCFLSHDVDVKSVFINNSNWLILT